jgi:hypothetical protein
MVVEAYVAHQIPGRVRLRIPAAKGRPDLLREIVAAAGSVSGIKSVEGNPVTGSLVIHHAPAAYKSFEGLVSVLADSTPHLSIHPSHPATNARSQRAGRGKRTQPSAAAQAITSFFRSLDREIREATDNEIDLKVLLPLAAGILGFFAFRRKAATPLWLTLMIFAFHSFLTLHGVAAAEEMDQIAINTADEAAGQ